MIRNKKLIAGAVSLAVVVAGGAAIAATRLSSSHASAAGPPEYSSGVGFGDGDGPGFGNGSGFRGAGFGAGGGFFGNLSGAAGFLGVSRSALESDLENGETLAEVADDQGRSVTGLVAALVSAQERELDHAVSSGRLTKAFAQSIESRLNDRITSLVNGIRPSERHRRFGGGPGPNPHGNAHGHDTF